MGGVILMGGELSWTKMTRREVSRQRSKHILPLVRFVKGNMAAHTTNGARELRDSQGSQESVTFFRRNTTRSCIKLHQKEKNEGKVDFFLKLRKFFTPKVS